jgi:hypothetical protein
MTALVSNYVFSPLSGLWSSIDHYARLLGYSRAAAELTKLGMHEEAKKLMMEAGKLRNDR